MATLRVKFYPESSTKAVERPKNNKKFTRSKTGEYRIFAKVNVWYFQLFKKNFCNFASILPKLLILSSNVLGQQNTIVL